MPRRSASDPVSDPVPAGVADLVAAVDRAAQLWPNRPAWTFDPGESLTFADVGRRSTALAAALAARGIAAGARVAVMMPNRAEFPLTWIALARVGLLAYVVLALIMPQESAVAPKANAFDDEEIVIKGS